MCKNLGCYLILFISHLFIVTNAYAETTIKDVEITTIKQEKTLYQELGEHPGLERIVNSFVRKIAKDKQMLPYFSKSSVSHFKKGFINHMCDISGGPCRYDGDTMIDIHTGMNINEGDFNRVVELLVLAMEDNGISYVIQNKLLAKLAPLRGDIIKM